MEMAFSVLGGLVGMVAGIASGLWVGGKLKGRASAWFWLANTVAVLLGMAGDVVGLITGEWWVVIASLAFMGGSLTGLKYGYGKSVGLWRVHDDLLGSEDLPRG